MNKDLIAQLIEIREITYKAKETGDLHPKTIKKLYEQIHNQTEVKTITQGIDLIVSKYKNELSVAAVKNYDNNLRHNITGYNAQKKKAHKLIDLKQGYPSFNRRGESRLAGNIWLGI